MGTTANAVTSLSLDPPLLPICFDRGSLTMQAIRGGDVLESSDVIAFAGAEDLGWTRTFSERVLGLPVIEHTSSLACSDAKDTMFRVTAVPKVARRRSVEDPTAGRVAWFADPEGNVLSLTQFG